MASVRGLRACSARSKSKTTSVESLRRHNATRAHRAVADGQYKKAVQSLTSMGLDLPSIEVFNEMLAKHSQVDPPIIHDSSSPPIQVSVEDV